MARLCTYNHAGLEQEVMHCLGDVCGVDKVVVRVSVLAVAHLQGLHKRHQSRNGDLR